MYTISAGLPHVLERIKKLNIQRVLENYSTLTVYDMFKYCETDEEYEIVYQEVI